MARLANSCRRLAAPTLGALALLVAAASLHAPGSARAQDVLNGTAGDLPPEAEPGAGGPVAAPETGALFGAWTGDNTGMTLEEREAHIGRRYQIVHRYHDWNDAFPTAVEQAWAREGRTLFINWISRIYGTTTVIPWSSIAAGEQDAVIDAQAARVRDFGAPVMITFMHEPEDNVGTEYGTIDEYVAAFRHVRNRFDAAGARNVSWVWNVMGWWGHRAMYASGLYPGDDVVDWIAWDPYNWYGCRSTEWKTFKAKVTWFYDWLVLNGHADKPFMLGEFGTTESESAPWAKGQWFQDALAVLKGGRFPNLKALVYFDASKECDWRVDSSAASLDGYRALANDPFMAP